MRSDKLTGGSVKDRLNEAVALSERQRFAIGPKRKAADSELAPLRFGACLGQPDGGDLRAAVRTAGDAQLVEGMGGEALDGLNADDPLMFGLVCQHGGAGDVTDGIDAGHVRAAEAVGDNETLIEL